MADKLIKTLKKDKINNYRAIPFWSWNDKLEPKELENQIEWMKKSGFGGYFMHARGGLKTEYLSDDWFNCIKTCTDAGKKLKMDSWAYDENGWPSGFAGGKLLEDPQNCDRYLTYTIGEFDKNSLVSYNIDGEKLIRVNEGGNGKFLNVYEHISPSTADILNGEVMDKFIALTHEEYKKRYGKNFSKELAGFFTDEPQYYRWHHAYTKVLKDYFKETYNEDILDGFGLMFVEKEGYRAFRYKYWLSMQALMLKNFAKKIYDWCDENGLKLTGHYIEEGDMELQMACCGGIMPFYQYEHIPGVDKLCRYMDGSFFPRQCSSVARQLGKKQVLTETYALCGWDVTPLELKALGEWQYVNGVNTMCQHLLPYSEVGQRKRDYPSHYSWVTPWGRKDLKSFNDFFARLGYVIGESEELVNVAVFFPIRSLYFDFKRENMGVLREKYISYYATCEILSEMNIPYHLIDETVMENEGKATTANGKLKVGKCTYDYVIFPRTLTMGKFSANLFEKFYSDGGKMLFRDEMPSYMEGEEHEYSFKSNITLEEIAAAQPYRIDDIKTSVRSIHLKYKGKELLFATNLSTDKAFTVEYSGNFKSFKSIDLETLEEKQISKKLDFEAGQSYLLELSDKECEYVEKKKEFTLDGKFELVKDSGNYMTLDTLRYSFDGEKYSEPCHYMGVFNEMLKLHYDGDLYLKYEFNVKEEPKQICFLTEDMNNVWCKVNGTELKFDGVSDFEKKIAKADITKLVKKGKNEAVIKIRFFEGENVYYALFGENVTEGLKNCLAYDTTIEACYLFGDFAVYEDDGLIKGKEKNVLIGNSFYIGTKKKEIEETVADGYPFFSGSIVLKKKFNYDGTAPVLNLKGRFHLCDIKVNGKEVKKSYFGTKVDLSDYLVKGENIAEITLYSSNRNLMGPHHCIDSEEPFIVAPETFELLGTWENGKSSKERDSYSFVKFGLFND